MCFSFDCILLFSSHSIHKLVCIMKKIKLELEKLERSKDEESSFSGKQKDVIHPAVQHSWRLSGAENIRAENSVEKSIAGGRSCFYHFNDHTLSRKFRVLTNSEILSENGSTGKNSIISIKSFSFYFLHSYISGKYYS